MAYEDEYAEQNGDEWTRRALYYLAASLTVIFAAFAVIAACTGEPQIVFSNVLIAGLAGMWTADRRDKLRA